jgi:3-oxoadipate enol-lactonase
MPDVRLGSDLTMHYEEDDCTDPWADAQTVVFLHGLAESGAVWYAWVPHFARSFRVLRPDLRGFGRSTVPPKPLEFPWSPRAWADDLARFLDALDVDAAHVVASRVGSTVALQLAADRPERVRSVSIVSGLARGSDLKGVASDGDGPRIPVADAPRVIAELGLAEYVARTNRSRLGSAASAELVEWSSALQARSDAEVVPGVLGAASGVDLLEVLPRISAPTLVLAAADSVVQTLAATREWQSLIPNSELEALPGDSPHLAAVHPDECAERVRAFIGRSSESL